MDRRELWLWLMNLPHIFSPKVGPLLERLGDIEGIYCAAEQQLRGIRGIGEAEIASLLDKDLSRARQIAAQIEGLGAYVLCYDDASYPDALRHLYDPPYVLYVRGERLNWDDMLPIAVVGARESTEYGRQVTDEICYDLAKSGVTVVSGMARGIDSVAHRSALRAGAKTVAFLGCGIDIVYPPENDTLMQAIAQNGAAMTEFPPGTPPYGKNFPIRNRLIAAFSRGVLVVEAKQRSGTASTAHWALENGKDVFAVPGDVTRENSKGCHHLIKSGGAKLAECAQDILEEYEYDLGHMDLPESGRPVIVEKRERPAARSRRPGREEKRVEKKKPSLDDERFAQLDEAQKKIIALLIERDAHVDEICRHASLSAAEAGAALTLMELMGLVTALAGKIYTLNV
ncbi:MAG TPA: DNA-protecting protein DprA [Candidatus Aphodoplasma excrementigallinarum]|uniref:DNA-protecting protein DprA n=1 Tax=Candidatus Aphodoplasma excrementigallinarum TaxID=2840673 RepID=A0A9D1NHQ0_9FIRM|nr:DNA-protecting protein DprA [Candidatus Aphodoplasma excrementigallinarum]